MNISNTKVYELEESIIASGLPMQTSYDSDTFSRQVSQLNAFFRNTRIDKPSPVQRAYRLSSTPLGSGHNNFLTGILVSANITATNAWWLQFERYHFAQIVSMQSKMHRLKQMLSDNFVCNEKTSPDSFKLCKSLMENGADEETVVYSCPLGIELTARITTNYMQLKTMHTQRRNHKLKEWHTFCDWIESLPLSKELITGEN